MSTSGQPESFPPARRRLSNFLSLAPNTSDSYPRAQKPKQPLAEQPLTADTLAEVPKKESIIDSSKRRTSSLSSDGSKSNVRFLKLGPVHFGEHQDEHKGDFFEVAVE
jgi:hypothetical protein